MITLAAMLYAGYWWRTETPEEVNAKEFFFAAMFIVEMIMLFCLIRQPDA